MRTAFFSCILATSACAARSSRPSIPVVYACDDLSLTRIGTEVKSSQGDSVHRLGWRDSDGDHFVAWPLSPTDRDATEYILPDDPRQDATQRTYDTTFGSSVVDWRLTRKEVCTARGGYSDVLTRWIHGETLDDLTTSLALGDRDETRGLIRHALVSLQRRYFHDQ